MWLSKQVSESAEFENAAALIGKVTVPGNNPAVLTEGEQRQVRLFAPGGYSWTPAIGDEVLVIRAGDGGELPCIAGAAGGTKTKRIDLNCTEAGLSLDNTTKIAEDATAVLSAGGACLLLKGDGTITIVGDVNVAGKLTVNGRPVVTEPEYA